MSHNLATLQEITTYDQQFSTGTTDKNYEIRRDKDQEHVQL